MHLPGTMENGMVVVVGVILCVMLLVVSLMGQFESPPARSQTHKRNRSS